MIEIGAKASVADLLLEIAIRGGNHADIHLVNPVAADPLDLALLQGTQQLRLQLQGKLSDLIEEERALVGHFELARPILRCPCKRAGEVAE